jgi:hypothetical protein
MRRGKNRARLSRGVTAGAENVVDRRGKIVHARARDDDCVPAAVSFLGNAEEPPTLILAEFEMKSLPFDLNFPRFENAIHF